MLHEERVNRLVTAFIDNYKKNEPLIPLDLDMMPDREVIVELTRLLRELLFPGYVHKKNPETRITPHQVGNLLETIHLRLTEQIIKALCNRTRECVNSRDRRTVADSAAITTEAKEKAFVFLEKIPDIRCILATDVQATFDGDPSARGLDEIVFSFPGIMAISIFRLAHELHKLDIPIIPRIMTEYAHSRTGIDIHPAAHIGHHFFIDHGTGVVVGETAVVGNHVRIYQGVTLGALSLKAGQALAGKKRHPTLQDNVIVYSGASILGGDTIIHEGAVIGSNTFITKSVSDNTTVSNRNPDLVYTNGREKT